MAPSAGEQGWPDCDVDDDREETDAEGRPSHEEGGPWEERERGEDEGGEGRVGERELDPEAVAEARAVGIAPVERVAPGLPVHVEVEREPYRMDAEVEQGDQRAGEHGEGQRQVEGRGPGRARAQAFLGSDHARSSSPHTPPLKAPGSSIQTVPRRTTLRPAPTTMASIHALPSCGATRLDASLSCGATRLDASLSFGATRLDASLSCGATRLD